MFRALRPTYGSSEASHMEANLFHDSVQVLPEISEVGSTDVLDEDGLFAVGRALRPDLKMWVRIDEIEESRAGKVLH